MNISSKEKRQIGIFLVVWALIAIAGVVFFWGQNPERLLRGVTSHDEISQVRIDIEDTLFPQTTAVLNGLPGGEMPESLGGIPVEQDVRDGWGKTLEQIERTVSRSTKEQLEADTGTSKSEGIYAFSSTQEPHGLFLKEQDNNIGVDTCGYFDYTYTESDDPNVDLSDGNSGADSNSDSSVAPEGTGSTWQGMTSSMVCIDVVIDRETLTITEARVGETW